eukprot:GHVL01024248.1.p1 GENE.GHVL01024248.1~~GHVL01024248.1.p1  ORF type:complete len:200 (+),score=10.40 GHVL01024248.1:529-1128(+)
MSFINALGLEIPLKDFSNPLTAAQHVIELRSLNQETSDGLNIPVLKVPLSRAGRFNQTITDTETIIQYLNTYVVQPFNISLFYDPDDRKSSHIREYLTENLVLLPLRNIKTRTKGVFGEKWSDYLIRVGGKDETPALQIGKRILYGTQDVVEFIKYFCIDGIGREHHLYYQSGKFCFKIERAIVVRYTRWNRIYKRRTI